MKELLSNYITEHHLISENDKVLVAVSGGVDSMTLLALLHQYIDQKSQIGVAHCNFTLRGGQSDAEQALVERTCKALGIECHSIRFETKKECQLTGESTQMAARRLRYNFFEELCQEYGYTRVAIAHHSDDSIETFFINLIRGTGIRGLTGINISRQRIIRPLLFASRLDIEHYALEHSIEYMTDSSNLSDDYLRNRLRHEIIPRIYSSTSIFGRTMSGNIERLSAAQRFIDSQIERIASEVIVDDTLDLTALEKYGEKDFLLFELLRPYGFSAEVVEDIVLATHTGKQFYSSTHIATLDRGKLLIRERSKDIFEERIIMEDDPAVEFIDPCSLMTLQTESNVALLSADSLQFPLRLRKWQSGDWFIPLGMHSQKKVSDFLIDVKVSLPDKEQQGVLVSGKTIVWLVGRRIDDRYKLTESTLRAVRITL